MLNLFWLPMAGFSRGEALKFGFGAQRLRQIALLFGKELDVFFAKEQSCFDVFAQVKPCSNHHFLGRLGHAKNELGWGFVETYLSK